MTLFRSLGRHLETGALDELTLTTNGSQLGRYAGELRECGVKRVNVSLDTLDPAKFTEITRRGRLDRVLAGLDAAKRVGLQVKINAVALRGVNEDEIDNLVAWCGEQGFDLVLIEVMPMGDIGGENRLEQYLPLSLVRARLERRWTLDDNDYRTGGPARYTTVRVRRKWSARFHHPADPQFLRKLQPGAADLHRHPLYVPRPGGRRRSAHAGAAIGKRRAARARDPRSDQPQTQRP